MFCDKSFCRSKARLALVSILLLGGAYLVMQHSAHLWAALPLAFLLACPLMHLFMHPRYGGDGARETSAAPTSAKRTTAGTETSHDT